MCLVLTLFNNSFINSISIDVAGASINWFDIFWILPNCAFFAIDRFLDLCIHNTKLWICYIYYCSTWTLEMHFFFLELNLFALNIRSSVVTKRPDVEESFWSWCQSIDWIAGINTHYRQERKCYDKHHPEQTWNNFKISIHTITKNQKWILLNCLFTFWNLKLHLFKKCFS